MFNDPLFIGPVSTFGTSTFGKITSVGGFARSMQFQVRFGFSRRLSRSHVDAARRKDARLALRESPRQALIRIYQGVLHVIVVHSCSRSARVRVGLVTLEQP